MHHVRKGTTKAVKFLGKQIKKVIKNRKKKIKAN